MMRPMAKRAEDAFFLRIWTEAEDDGEAPPGAQWRALIQHVGTQERRYFTNYGELCEFLDRYCRPVKQRL